MLLQILFGVLGSDLHNLTYRLSKIKTRKKAWNGRSKPWRFSIYADNRCGVHVWRPLLYQLSYTPKCLVAAMWAALTCREYDTTYTRFCQEIFDKKHAYLTRDRVRRKVSWRAADLRFWNERVSSARQSHFSCHFSGQKTRAMTSILHSLDHWSNTFSEERFGVGVFGGCTAAAIVGEHLRLLLQLTVAALWSIVLIMVQCFLL